MQRESPCSTKEPAINTSNTQKAMNFLDAAIADQDNILSDLSDKLERVIYHVPMAENKGEVLTSGCYIANYIFERTEIINRLNARLKYIVDNTDL